MWCQSPDRLVKTLQCGGVALRAPAQSEAVSSPRWQETRSLFESALDRRPEDRDRFLREECPDDEGQPVFVIPEFIARMVEKKQLGRKTKAGFFKREKGPKGENVDYVLDWRTGAYRPKAKLDAPSLKQT